MADYDRRPRGGRGAFHNNRKRRYREDDDFDRRQQRRRYEEPLAVTLRKQILSIAESPIRKVEEDVSSIAKTLADNYFDSDITAGSLSLLIQMIVEQPLKIPFIAAIVLLLNKRKPEFTEEILKSVADATQKHLEAGNWRQFRLYLRFLGCLQGLFEGNGIFPLLHELFARAADCQMASSEDSLGLEVVKIILYTVAYTMSSSAVGFVEEANQILAKTAIIASEEFGLASLVSLVDPFDSKADGATQTQGALLLLQQLFQQEAQRNWEFSCLPRPWKSASETASETDDELPLASAQKHAFPSFNVPNPLQSGPNPIYPEVYFSVYQDQECETVPPQTDITAFLVRDTLTDTINALDFNRHASAKFLIEMDCYFAPDTFVKRGTAFDKLRSLGLDKTWKPEDVAVEAAFSQLFKLPAPEHKLVYYHSVLTEACKIAPAAIAPSLGRAIRYMYRNVDRLDLEIAQRFLDWFAHHLSNFGFTWKWTEWVEDIDLSGIHPKKSFMGAALDKEIRLSFAQRIKGTLPEPLQPLIPESKSKDVPEFKYTNGQTLYSAQGLEIAQLIRRKGTDAEIVPLIESIEREAMDQNLDPTIASTDAFVTAICFIGSKSLSHVLSCIERCKDRLLAIGNSSPAARRHIITSVMAYWESQPGVGVNIVDKLLNYTILTPESVVEWVLIDRISRGALLAQNYAYEMIDMTIKKVTKRVRQIVAAIRRPALPEEQVTLLNETLDRERGDMQRLFSLIEDTLTGLNTRDDAEAGDAVMAAADGSTDAEVADVELVKKWARRWTRVFQRRQVVEKTWIDEELLKPIPEPAVPEEDGVKMDDAKAGDAAANGIKRVKPNPFGALEGVDSAEHTVDITEGIE